MFVEFFIFVIFVLLCAYHNVTKRWKKFHRRGIPFAEPYFPFGSWHNWKLLILPNAQRHFSQQFLPESQGVECLDMGTSRFV